MKKRFLIPATILTIFWTVFIFYFLYPAGKDYLNRNNKNYINRKLKEIDYIGEEIQLIKTQQEDTKNKIFPPTDILIKADNIKPIMVRIRKATDAINIKTLSVELGEIKRSSESELNVSEQNIEVLIKSPYHKIAQYINILKASPLITNIYDIKITKDQNSDNLKTELKFKVLCTP